MAGGLDRIDSDDAHSLKRWRLFLLIFTALTFLPVLGGAFLQWDDNRHLVDNPLLRIGRMHEFWMHPYFGLYVPITYSIWTLLAAVSGRTPLNPVVFHSLNLIVHLGSVLIVFALLRELFQRATVAALGASLFAVHPLQVEPIAWVSGFRDVAGGFFALLAIWQYVTANRRDTESKLHLAIATIAFVLAMLCKPTTIVTPLICVVLDRRRCDVAIAWLLLAIPIAIITRIAQPVVVSYSPNGLQRIFIAGDTLDFYLKKIIWPLDLGVDYGRTPAIVMGLPYWRNVFSLAVPVVIGIVAWLLRRRAPMLWIGLLIGVIALLPMLGFASFDFQRYSTVADRYAYLPMVGICIAASALVATLHERWLRWLWILPVLLAGRSFVQTFVWHDGVTLFTHALEVNDRSALACSQLAATALDADRPDEAQHWAVQAMDRNPNWALPYVTYGLATMRTIPPDTATAERAYRTALAHDPQFGSALTNLAALLAQQSRFTEAEQLCREALASDPSDISAHIDLGNILAAQGKLHEAAAEYVAALTISPENAQARQNLSAIVAAQH